MGRAKADILPNVIVEEYPPPTEQWKVRYIQTDNEATYSLLSKVPIKLRRKICLLKLADFNVYVPNTGVKMNSIASISYMVYL